MKKVLAIIPARAGSKRFPGKNTAKIHGKTLIDYAIDAAKNSKYITRIVISSDDTEVKKVALKRGIFYIDRPEELAQDKSSSADVIVHAVDFLEEKEDYLPDIVVLLQPTSPLRIAEDIDKTIAPVFEGKADSAQSVSSVREHPALMISIGVEGRLIPYEKDNHLKRSQEFKELYIKNGAVYVFLTSVLRETKNMYGKNHQAIITPYERSVDIDYPEDMALVEFYLSKGEKNE